MVKEKVNNDVINERKRFYVSSGSPIKDVFQRYLTEDGFYSVHKVGEHNLYEEIQIDINSGNIADLIKRYQAGDLSAFPSYNNVDIDITNLPDNIHDLHKKVESVKEIFDRLPNDVREKYDFSFSNFLKNPDLNDFIQKEVIEPSQNKEVNIDEKKSE